MKLFAALNLSLFSAILIVSPNAQSQVTYSHRNITVTGTPADITSADFNHDGKPDFAIVNNQGFNSAYVRLATANASNYTTVSLNFSNAGSNQYNLVEAVRLNNDAHPDIVVGSTSGRRVVMFTNNGSGGFTQTQTIDLNFYEVTGIAVADFNADGRSDLAVITGTTPQLTVYKGLANGTFSASSNFSQTYSGFNLVFKRVKAADLNGDSKADLVISSTNGITILRSTSTASTINFATAASVTGQDSDALALSDLNKDHRIDAVTVDPSSGAVQVFLQASNGNFTAQSPVAGTSGSSQDVTVGLVNNDRTPNVVVTNYSGSTIRIYRTSNSGVLTSLQILSSANGVSSNPTAVVLRDTNADGQNEIVTVHQNGPMVIFSPPANPGLIYGNSTRGCDGTIAMNETGATPISGNLNHFLRITNAPQNALTYVFVSLDPGNSTPTLIDGLNINIPIPGISNTTLGPILTDASGSAGFALPIPAVPVGTNYTYLNQAFTFPMSGMNYNCSANSNGLTSSTGFQFAIH